MRTNENSVVKKYENLIKKQQRLCDELSNLDKEKNYKVQKVEREYNSKIDDKTREIKAVSLQIDNVQRYVKDISSAENCSAIGNIVPKK
jgi:phage host-nuclease inhibitor protein Gam